MPKGNVSFHRQVLDDFPEWEECTLVLPDLIIEKVFPLHTLSLSLSLLLFLFVFIFLFFSLSIVSRSYVFLCRMQQSKIKERVCWKLILLTK